MVVARRTETSHGLSSASRTGPVLGYGLHLRSHTEGVRAPRRTSVRPRTVCASGQEADLPHVRRLEARPVPAKDRRSGDADRAGDHTREQISARIKQLLENPRKHRDNYDQLTDQWTTTYGGGAGLIAMTLAVLNSLPGRAIERDAPL
jgi:hypothetical protein